MDPQANMTSELIVPLYHHDVMLVLRQLSLYVTLLEDREHPIGKENAEAIIRAIVSQ